MTNIVALIEPLQSALNADGVDLRLTSEQGGVVRFQLTLAGANCADCVLPRRMLQDVVLAALQPQLPFVTAVVIDDPRESAEESRDDRSPR